MKNNTKYDFDEIIDRRNTSCEKWDRYAGRDVIPMWVADMDFAAPPEVLEALYRHIDHGVLGYPVTPPELNDEVVAMLARRYGWQIEPEWIVWLPGLVTGLNICCRAFAKEGEAVATFTPVYPPFLSAPLWSERKRITVPLQLRGDEWQMDLQLFEESITPDTRALLLCHPHNPTGRDYTSDEIRAICDNCLKHEIVICSDEIHSELILKDAEHVPAAAISPEIADSTVTLMAPSKTYNIPGLGCSFAIASNAQLRGQLRKTKRGIVPHVNALGYTAALAAYRHAEPWRQELLAYLRKNQKVVYDFVNNELPGCRMTPVEATYLAWIDIRELNLDNPEGFFEAAGVGLMAGHHFGLDGYIRLNFGCPRKLLIEGLQRMKKAIIP